MSSRGWVLPADEEKPLRQSTLFEFKKEQQCEVDFTVRDLDDFHLIVFYDDRGIMKDLQENTRAFKLAEFEVVGDVFLVCENGSGVVMLTEEQMVNTIK